MIFLAFYSDKTLYVFLADNVIVKFIPLRMIKFCFRILKIVFSQCFNSIFKNVCKFNF